MQQNEQPSPLAIRTDDDRGQEITLIDRIEPCRSSSLPPVTASFISDHALPGLGGDTDTAREPIMNEFAARYERLVAILCDAARYGCAPRLELQYADIRRWMLDRRLGGPMSAKAKLRLSNGDRTEGQSEDPIELIVGPASLADLLARDSGKLIEYVTKASEAVYSSFSPSRTDVRSAGD
jgi:hypothetical protein